MTRTVSAAPVAAVYLWLDTGSAEERADECGAAHLLEHMLFKGTTTRPVGASAAAIEEVGGTLNAFTSFHETVLHTNLPSASWRIGLEVIADMALRPLLDAEELERELGVVLGEIREAEGDPDDLVEQRLLTHLFPDHAYGRPILGTAASVQKLSRDALHRFWQRAWHPERAILAVAGDIDPDVVLAAAGEILGDWTAPPLPATTPTLPEELTEPVLEMIDENFESIAVQLGWRAVDCTHPDAAPLDLLAAALGDGAAPLLVGELQHDKQLGTDFWSSVTTHRHGGLFTIGIAPRTGRTAEAAAATLAIVERIRRDGLPGSALQRAREAVLADLLFAEETVDSVAHDLAWYTARYGDPGAADRYRDQIALVDHDDIQRVARTWLVPRCLAAVVLDDQVTQATMATAVSRPSRRAARRAGITRHTLPNGIRIVVSTEDTPVVGARVLAMGGQLRATSRRAGIGNAWAEVVTTATHERDPTALAEMTDRLAMTLAGVSSSSTVALDMTVPAPHATDALDCLAEVLVEPAFDPDEWERIRDELLEELGTLRDRPGTLATELARNALWRGHPWRLPALGTEASLARMTPRALAAWHTQHLHGRNLVVAVTGGIDPDLVLERLGPLLETIPTEGDALPPRPDPRPVWHPRSTTSTYEQAVVTLSAPGARWASRDHLVLALAMESLGAQSGRLFMDLRERRGLGYSVWSRVTAGADGGQLELGLSTEPGRLEEGHSGLWEAWRDIAARPLTSAEITRGKNMLLGMRSMALQRCTGRAAHLASCEHLNLEPGVDALRTRLNALDDDEIRATTQQFFALEPLSIRIRPEPC